MTDSADQPSMVKAQEAVQAGDWVRAINLYESLARLGSGEAMIRLADIYNAGDMSKAREFQDFDAARYWYERAYREADMVEGILCLGAIYYFGRGVPQDYEKAFCYYKILESTDCAVGLLRLGAMYEQGLSVTKDVDKARDLYSRAARCGNIFGRKNLGVLLWKHLNNPFGLLLWGWAICQGIYFFTFNNSSPRIRAW